MCRFLLARTDGAPLPRGLVGEFAAMAEASRAPDGDRQADGWGAAWPDGAGGWAAIASTAPVWKDRARFAEIPQGPVLVLHARSASFPAHKNILAYNQPYAAGPFAFVFNGMLQGVALPHPVTGEIGAQKIWSLVRGRLAADGPAAALNVTASLLERSARRIQGLNIGLADAARAYALCRFTEGGTYYQLYRHASAGLRMIASEPLASFDFSPVPQGEVVEI